MSADTDDTNTSEPESTRDEAPASGEAPPSEPAGDPLAQAQAEAARLKDQWMRTAADFDNFRKRSRRELEETRKAGKEDLLKEFLPVFDNLERAIQSAQTSTDVKGVADGLQLVHRQFIDTLARAGITRVESVGAQFDPTFHDAIQQVESDEHPSGSVVAEVLPGYMQGDRLVRAAMVVVAKAKEADPAGDAASEGDGASES